MSILNAGATARRISIEDSCGCLVVSPTILELGPGEEGTVTASLAPDGRPGLRRSQITVSAKEKSGGRSATPNVTLTILATVTITSEWHATPQRLVVARAAADGTVSVAAPAADWETATIDTIGGDFSWEETSRSPGPGGEVETRTFRVAVTGDGDRGLSFTLGGRESPLLVVPIMVSP